MPTARRSELKRQYKETPRQAGVFCITNGVNGKIFLGSSTNLHGPLNRHRFMLTIGKHANAALQADWDRHGAEAFTFEIVAAVEQKEDPGFDLGEELWLLEQIWLEKTRPVGAHGYNEDERIRER